MLVSPATLLEAKPPIACALSAVSCVVLKDPTTEAACVDDKLLNCAELNATILLVVRLARSAAETVLIVFADMAAACCVDSCEKFSPAIPFPVKLLIAEEPSAWTWAVPKDAACTPCSEEMVEALSTATCEVPKLET